VLQRNNSAEQPAVFLLVDDEKETSWREAMVTGDCVADRGDVESGR
jgi:hypothetical protein